MEVSRSIALDVASPHFSLEFLARDLSPLEMPERLVEEDEPSVVAVHQHPVEVKEDGFDHERLDFAFLYICFLCCAGGDCRISFLNNL